MLFASWSDMYAFSDALLAGPPPPGSGGAWAVLLGALVPGCGSLATYQDTAGEAYSVCGTPGQTSDCRWGGAAGAGAGEARDALPGAELVRMCFRGRCAMKTLKCSRLCCWVGALA